MIGTVRHCSPPPRLAALRKGVNARLKSLQSVLRSYHEIELIGKYCLQSIPEDVVGLYENSNTWAHSSLFRLRQLCNSFGSNLLTVRSSATPRAHLSLLSHTHTHTIKSYFLFLALSWLQIGVLHSTGNLISDDLRLMCAAHIAESIAG